VKWLALAALVLSGCAYRIQPSPQPDTLPLMEGCFLYCRITDCTAKDIPPPLIPSVSDPVNGIPPLLKAPKGVTVDDQGHMGVSGDDTHCTTLEVGAKSYSDTIAAIGMALGAIWLKIHGIP
jgi:hypothetical protein